MLYGQITFQCSSYGYSYIHVTNVTSIYFDERIELEYWLILYWDCSPTIDQNYYQQCQLNCFSHPTIPYTLHGNITILSNRTHILLKIYLIISWGILAHMYIIIKAYTVYGESSLEEKFRELPSLPKFVRKLRNSGNLIYKIPANIKKCKKTFVNASRFAKFTNFFFCGWFPLYGTLL